MADEGARRWFVEVDLLLLVTGEKHLVNAIAIDVSQGKPVVVRGSHRPGVLDPGAPVQQVGGHALTLQVFADRDRAGQEDVAAAALVAAEGQSSPAVEACAVVYIQASADGVSQGCGAVADDAADDQFGTVAARHVGVVVVAEGHVAVVIRWDDFRLADEKQIGILRAGRVKGRAELAGPLAPGANPALEHVIGNAGRQETEDAVLLAGQLGHGGQQFVHLVLGVVLVQGPGVGHEQVIGLSKGQPPSFGGTPARARVLVVGTVPGAVGDSQRVADRRPQGVFIGGKEDGHDIVNEAQGAAWPHRGEVVGNQRRRAGRDRIGDSPGVRYEYATDTHVHLVRTLEAKAHIADGHVADVHQPGVLHVQRDSEAVAVTGDRAAHEDLRFRPFHRDQHAGRAAVARAIHCGGGDDVAAADAAG